MTTDKLDAIWWNGYEKGAIDSAYEIYDLDVPQRLTKWYRLEEISARK